MGYFFFARNASTGEIRLLKDIENVGIRKGTPVNPSILNDYGLEAEWTVEHIFDSNLNTWIERHQDFLQPIIQAMASIQQRTHNKPAKRTVRKTKIRTQPRRSKR